MHQVLADCLAKLLFSANQSMRVSPSSCQRPPRPPSLQGTSAGRRLGFNFRLLARKLLKLNAYSSSSCVNFPFFLGTSGDTVFTRWPQCKDGYVLQFMNLQLS